MDTTLDALKTPSKKAVYKTGEFLGNKFTDAVATSNDVKIEKQEPVEVIIIAPEEKDEIINKLR